MGQRLIISIYNYAHMHELASIYQHWGGFTNSAMEQTVEIVEALQQTQIEDFEKLSEIEQQRIIVDLLMKAIPGAIIGEYSCQMIYGQPKPPAEDEVVAWDDINDMDLEDDDSISVIDTDGDTMFNNHMQGDTNIKIYLKQQKSSKSKLGKNGLECGTFFNVLFIEGLRDYKKDDPDLTKVTVVPKTDASFEKLVDGTAMLTLQDLKQINETFKNSEHYYYMIEGDKRVVNTY